MANIENSIYRFLFSFIFTTSITLSFTCCCIKLIHSNVYIREGKEAQDAKEIPQGVDARWTKKRGENHYGYKNHIKADKKAKLIEQYHTTDASVHDSVLEIENEFDNFDNYNLNLLLIKRIILRSRKTGFPTCSLDEFDPFLEY